MLAGLYLGYVIVLAKLKPGLMPPLAAEQRRVPLPSYAERLAPRGRHALTGLARALTGDSAGVPKRTVAAQFFVSLLPALAIAFVLIWAYRAATAPVLESTPLDWKSHGLRPRCRRTIRNVSRGRRPPERRPVGAEGAAAEAAGAGLADPPTQQRPRQTRGSKPSRPRPSEARRSQVRRKENRGG